MPRPARRCSALLLPCQLCLYTRYLLQPICNLYSVAPGGKCTMDTRDHPLPRYHLRGTSAHLGPRLVSVPCAKRCRNNTLMQPRCHPSSCISEPTLIRHQKLPCSKCLRYLGFSHPRPCLLHISHARSSCCEPCTPISKCCVQRLRGALGCSVCDDAFQPYGAPDIACPAVECA